MELTVTLQGSAAELRHVLELLEGIDDIGPSQQAGDRDLHRFVAHASPPMLAALRAVADASVKNEAVTRLRLAEAAGISGEAELNGVLGSIGRAWARAVGGENPFLGATDAEGRIVYRIDRDLAERIAALQRAREEGGWPGLGRGRGRGLGRGRRGRSIE